MKMEIKVNEMVEAYFNGNISDFKFWIKKKANKKEVILATQILGNKYWEQGERGGYEKAVRIVYHCLLC